MASYYRRHIKDFAQIASHLTNLIKNQENKNSIIWNKEHEDSFNLLRDCLIKAPVLSHFSENNQLILTTDASIQALGAVLEQRDQHGNTHPIGYASRKVMDTERTYSSTTLELLGLVYGCEYFREFLYGRRFTVYCDNISLQYYKKLKTPTARISRLILKLLDYDFEIIYKQGKENKVADALSRQTIENIIDSTILGYETENNYVIKNIKNDNIEYITNIAEINIKKEQNEDEFCKNMIDILKGKEVTPLLKRKSRQFTIQDDTLYFKKFSKFKGLSKLLVIPNTLIHQILESYHSSPNSGHIGISRLVRKIQEKYFWTTLTKDTIKFVKSCHSCQINKKSPGKSAELLNPIKELTGQPLQRITIDFLGPLPSSNNKKYILVGACNTTKYVIAKAVRYANADSVVKFLFDFVATWGVPKKLCSDRGLHFRNDTVDKVCKNLGVEQVFSTSYAPQTQGFVEKTNGTICQALKHYMSENKQSRWSFYLPFIIFSYNSSIQTTTNFSPFFLMHGFEANLPIDNKLIPENLSYNIKKSLEDLHNIRSKLPNIISSAQIKQKVYHDKNHKHVEYLPGQLVLIQFPFQEIGKSHKLAPIYRGPFEIISKINDVNYKVKLKLNNRLTEDIVHVRRIKLYHNRVETDTTTEQNDIPDKYGIHK
jgi:hypothetical protein